MLRLFKDLIDLLNFNRIAKILVDYDLYNFFLELEMYLAQEDFLSQKTELIKEMFITLINKKDLPKCLHMITIFESNLLTSAKHVVPVVLKTLELSKWTKLESYLTIL